MEIHQIARQASDFQQPVNEDALRLQLYRVLPGEEIHEVKELPAGLFNSTYRIDTAKNAYILKVAPRTEADLFFNERNLMQRERSISRQLQSASPLIPDYLSFFTVDGREASLQPLIGGRLWHDEIAALTPAENARLWEQLGVFARTLHRCCGERFGYPAPSPAFHHWSGFIAYNVEGLVDDCRRFGVLCDEVEAYYRSLPRFYEALDQVKTARLLHGDLWPQNVIIDGTGDHIHLKAVFDGERAFWGDPACDWVLILYGVPDAFWQGYGEHVLETRDPACIAVYRGMYFIVNILECVRSRESDEAARMRLSGINTKLAGFL